MAKMKIQSPAKKLENDIFEVLVSVRAAHRRAWDALQQLKELEASNEDFQTAQWFKRRQKDTDSFVSAFFTEDEAPEAPASEPETEAKPHGLKRLLQRFLSPDSRQ